MKKLILCFSLLFTAFCGFAQSWQHSGNELQFKVRAPGDTIWSFSTGITTTPPGRLSFSPSGGGGIVPGGPITTIPVLAFNPGTNLSSSAWIIATFYGALPPTAGLTGGVASEKSGSNLSGTLNWSYGRQSNTGLIISADITPGPFHEFGSQPAQPGTVTGTQAVTITANTNTTFTMLVTDGNGKTASASTSYTWFDKKYYGWVADTTSISQQGVYDDTILLALSSDNLGSVKAATFSPGNTAGGYLVFMYPASDGVLSSITINGLQSIAAFQHVSRNFTNGAGSPFTQAYLIYWTINEQIVSSAYSVSTN